MKYWLIVIASVICLLQPFLLFAQQRSPYPLQQRRVPANQNTASLEQSPFMLQAQEAAKERDKKAEYKLDNQAGLDFNMQVGYIYGEVHELVMASSSDSYPVDSQLTWKMQDTLNVSASVDINFNRVYVKLGASLPLVLTKSEMEDRDWLFDNPPGGASPYSGLPASAASHYSISDTENEFSFSAYGIFAFNLLEKGSAPRLELGASFLYMTWAWRALDTQGLYFLDDSGVFGGYRPLASTGDTVTYRVHYLVPAASLRFSAKWGVYGIEVLLNYSPSAFFFDHDSHIVTKVDSDGFGFLGQMLWGGVTNRLWLTKSFSLNLGVQGKVLFRTRIGSLTQTDTSTGETTTVANAAGSEYFDIEAFAGVTLRF